MTAETGAPLLRPVRPADSPAVVDLLARVYAEYGQVMELDTLDADLLRLEEAYAAPHAFRVLAVEGTVVGTAACKLVAPGECALRRVFLDAAWRGRGHGKRLVLWAFDHARSLGARRVLVWTDVLFDTAHAMYRHLGCEDTGETRHLGGRNAIDERLLVKRLDAAPPG